MSYEVFEKVIRRVTTPMLTISQLGRLNFNTAASEVLNKHAVEDVLLMWDKESSKIGVRGINKKDTRSYRMRFSRRNKSAGFAAKPFLEHIGYDYSQTKAYPCTWNEEQGMFETSLPSDAFTAQPERIQKTHGQKSSADSETKKSRATV